MKTSKIIVWVLSLLGFAGCDALKVDMYGSPPVEYGTPYAEFEVKGTVTDDAGTPVAGIEVSAKLVEQSGRWDYDLPVATTDARGEYLIDDPRAFPHAGKLHVTATDVDGEANGEFETSTGAADVKYSDYTGGKGWFEGRVSKTVDVTLTPKPAAEQGE